MQFGSLNRLLPVHIGLKWHEVSTTRSSGRVKTLIGPALRVGLRLILTRLQLREAIEEWAEAEGIEIDFTEPDVVAPGRSAGEQSS